MWMGNQPFFSEIYQRNNNWDLNWIHTFRARDSIEWLREAETHMFRSTISLNGKEVLFWTPC